MVMAKNGDFTFDMTRQTFEPRREKTRLWRFPNRCDTNSAVQAQKMARSLKLNIRGGGIVLSMWCKQR